MQKRTPPSISRRIWRFYIRCRVSDPLGKETVEISVLPDILGFILHYCRVSFRRDCGDRHGGDGVLYGNVNCVLYQDGGGADAVWEENGEIMLDFCK